MPAAAHPREAPVGRGRFRPGRGAQPRPAPGRRPGVGQRQREAQEQRDELEQVHPGRGQEPPAAEVEDEDQGGQERAGDARQARDHLEGPGHGEELPGEQGERPQPQHRGDQHAHRAIEAPLQEVPDREEAVLARQAVQARGHDEAQDQAPDGGRARPPPGRQAVPVAEAGRAHRRAGSDVRGENRHEDHRSGERAGGDEEVARDLDPPGDEDARAHHEGGVDEQQDVGRGQAPGPDAQTRTVGSKSFWYSSTAKRSVIPAM